MDGEGFYRHGGRLPLNLVVVLDISGSMGEGFSYKDEKTKIVVARESLLALMAHLKAEDHFGLVLFDDQTEVMQELARVDGMDLAGLKEGIAKIETRGGTDLEAGFRKGMEVMRKSAGMVRSGSCY